VHLSRRSARVGLLAVSVALIAMFVATSTASAARFSGGSIKVDFKSLKVTVKTVGAASNNKTGGTFPFAENAGTLTMTKQASGSLNIGAASTSVTLTKSKKSIVLKSFVEKLSSGKGQLTAKIGGKGKAVAFFDQASTNRVNPSADFTALSMTSSKMTLTKAGAAALNKAFGLKAPKRGQKDTRFKAKGAVGTASFTAERSLTVVGGSTSTIYDQAFVNALRNCNIELSAVAPGTAIAKDAAAPEGGVTLPVNAAAGGALNAKTLIGTVNHQGGTSLDRPAPGQPGNPGSKAEYHSPLRDFEFGFSPGNNSLTAFIVNANGKLPIGTVVGTPVATLTDTGGSVALNNGSLNLSESASGTLSQAAPPLGADCPIPAGSKIGAINMTANVE
jgi:hypothetical protein